MKNKTFHSGGIPCIYLTGKFANCTPEILKVYYKICREHQNCATEIGCTIQTFQTGAFICILSSGLVKF